MPITENLIAVRAKTQFKPGQSGNLAGVPKGTKHITTWVQELLTDNKFVTQIQQGYTVVDYKGAPIKALLQAQLQLALNSRDEGIRIKATELLLKYGWSQKSEVDAKVTMVTPIMKLEELNAVPGNDSNDQG